MTNDLRELTLRLQNAAFAAGQATTEREVERHLLDASEARDAIHFVAGHRQDGRSLAALLNESLHASS